MFKKFRKVATKVAVMAFALVLTATVAFAAEKKPGESGSEPIVDATGVYGIQGTITVSGDDILDSYSLTNNTSISGEVTSSAAFLYGTSAATGNLTVNYTVKSSAQVGQSCVITFNYDTSDENGNMTRGKSGSVTVTVGQPTTGGGGGGSTGVTNPTPVAPTKKADLTELNRLIAIADKLTKSDYTNASWEELLAAYNKAKAMTVYNTQAQVDAAAEALQAAIDGLVKIDYTELLAAIESAKELMGDTDFAQLWNELLAALDNANANLKGTSQEEVDSAAAALKAIVEKLDEILKGLSTPVEPVPAEDCTVPFHKIAVMLLPVSAILNVILGFIIANNSKKRKQDNVPMVKH